MFFLQHRFVFFLPLWTAIGNAYGYSCLLKGQGTTKIPFDEIISHGYTELEINNTGITSLKGISCLTNLTRIILIGNDYMVDISMEMKDLPHLTELSVTHCPQLSVDIAHAIKNGGFRRLQKLDLMNTSMISLPLEMKEMSDLRVLNVYGNGITDFPGFLMHMPFLEELYIGGNPIMTLPWDIRNMYRLRVLSLYNCQLECLPNWRITPPLLREFYIGGNPMKLLPAWILDLVNSLVLLDIRNNVLMGSTNHDSALVGLGNLLQAAQHSQCRIVF